MDDLLDNALDVSMPVEKGTSIASEFRGKFEKNTRKQFENSTPPLREVDGSKRRLALPVLRVGHEDRARALPLGSDDTTHL